MIRSETVNAATGDITVETWDVTAGYARTVNGTTVEQRALTPQELAVVTATEAEERRAGNHTTLIDPAGVAAYVTNTRDFIAKGANNTAAEVRTQTLRNSKAMLRLLRVVIGEHHPELLDDITDAL
jgi:hypothetical protein